MSSQIASRGEIYRLLASPVYVGDIGHKDKRYAGQHAAIVDRETFTAVQMQLAANTHARYVRLDAKDPSLLAGLLQDEQGNRLTPTHASKQGRRYRYYVVQSVKVIGRGQGRPRGSERRLRVAAADIETVVVETLCNTLLDRRWLLTKCAPPSGALAHQKAVIAKAEELAERLRTPNTGERRELLLAIVMRVTIADTEVCVTVRREGLATRLGLPPSISPATTGSRDPSPGHEGVLRGRQRRRVERADGSNGRTNGLSDDDLVIVAPVTLRRRGVETKLIIDGPDGPNTAPHPDIALIKVIAQAHRWKDDILSGRFPTLRTLARTYDKDERYVARLLPLAFLAPRIVDATLAGEHPIDLTAQDLVTLNDMPPDWSVQATKLGFMPPRRSR